MRQDLIKIIAELYSMLDDIRESNDHAKAHLHEAIDGLERLVLDLND